MHGNSLPRLGQSHELPTELDNVTDDAQYGCIKPECLHDSRHLTIFFIITIYTVVLCIHDVAQSQTQFKNQCDGYETVEVVWNYENDGQAHNYWCQDIEENLIEWHEQKSLTVNVLVLITSLHALISYLHI